MCRKVGVTAVNQSNLSYTTGTISLHDILRFSPMPEGPVAPASPVVPDPDIKHVPVVSDMSDFSFLPSDSAESTDVSDLLTDSDHYPPVESVEEVDPQETSNEHPMPVAVPREPKQAKSIPIAPTVDQSIPAEPHPIDAAMPDAAPDVQESSPAPFGDPTILQFVPVSAPPPPTIAPQPPASSATRDVALINILHTISDQMMIYLQYAVARDQAMCSALQHPFSNLDHIWPPSPDFPLSETSLHPIKFIMNFWLVKISDYLLAFYELSDRLLRMLDITLYFACGC